MRAVFALMLAVGGVAKAAQETVETNVDLPRYPAISRDGKKVAFSWRGDIWTVPVNGGLAERLTTNAFDDLYPQFSPDGKKLAFVSERVGGMNIFKINLDGTNLEQVTFTDRPMALTQWAKNEKGEERLLVSSMLEPMPFSMPKGYEMSPEGGDVTEIYGAGGSIPVMSPDGSKVLFVRGATQWSRRGYRGPDNRDVWMYDKGTKKYTKLTVFNGNDGKPKWLNNETIVFVSDRVNNTYNLFTLKVGAADDSAKAITSFNGEGVDDFDVAGDGTIVLSCWDKLYTLNANSGGSPAVVPVRAGEEEGDRYRFQTAASSVSECALSPDGKAMAIISYGEVYVRGTDTRSPTRRIAAELGGRKRDIAWSADGERVLFVCDATGKEEIYQATVKVTRTELRRKAGAIPSTEREGPGGPPTGAATQPATQPAVNPPVTPEGEMLDEGNGEQVRRQLPPGFTVPTPGGTGGTAGGAGSAPATPSSEPSKWGDALAFEVKKLWDAKENDRRPTFTPDGKYLVYLQEGTKLVLREEGTGKERVIASNFDNIDFRISPDSRYIAYSTEDRNNNSDIWVVPVEGTEKAVNISKHPAGDYAPRWSADSKILAFLSNRTGIGDETAVYWVYLDKELEQLASPELEAYYRDQTAAVRRRTPPATRPSTTQPTTRVSRRGASTQPGLRAADLEDAYLRIRRWTNIRGSISDLELSLAGDRIYFVGYLGSQRGLLTQPRPGSGAAASEPTRIANPVSMQHLSVTGDSMAVVDGGGGGPSEEGADTAPRGRRAAVVKLPGGETEYYDPSDRMKVDLRKLSEQKFLEAARIMATNFYNPKMNGVDWPAMTKKYLPLASNARTADEFEFIANKFVGELNASHLGVSAPSSSSPLAQSSGRLGIKTSRVANGLKVEDVTPEGPSDRGVMKLKVGDVITAINFEQVGPKDTLEKLLVGKSGVETVVSVSREGKSLDLLITPTSFESLNSLAYNRWRLAKLEEVKKLSGGKIGYIHIQGMNQASLETYKRDLFAACDGMQAMIIDVRWNGGGSTADLLLSSIMAPYHAYTVPRGAPAVTDSYPGDRLFIPRFIGPINMLCNERSFSNAEITAHAFKTLKRGTLVGNQTAGGVISTGSASLLDGTTIRTPGRGWYTPDGTNMELNGALPDILIVQTPDDEVSGDDRQLKAAVEDLMKRLK